MTITTYASFTGLHGEAVSVHRSEEADAMVRDAETFVSVVGQALEIEVRP